MEYGNGATAANVTPLLAGFAVPRSNAVEIPGHYSDALQVWVIEVNGEPVPIVSAIRDLAECVTKTMSQMESDDESRPPPRRRHCELPAVINQGLPGLLLELATKTETRRERDDR